MMEYIEREKILSLAKDICVPTKWGTEYRHRSIDPLDVIELPAADVRPVVLCRDCRHRDPEDHKCDCGQFERAGCVFPVDDNYFCAYGEE